MPPQISFSSIPQNLRIPLMWFETDNSQAGVNQQANQRSLLIGQTVTAQPAVPVLITTADQAVGLFGATSMLAQMVKAYRLADPFGELWALPLADDGAGAAATATITVTGPSTAAGTISLYIDGTPIAVPVTAGQAQNSIATAIGAAIAAATGLPVTAGVATNVVTLTAVNKGTIGNQLDARLNYYGVLGGEATPAGVTLAITAFSGGGTDPSLATLDAILGDNLYDFIGLPYTAAGSLNSIGTLMGDASGRWSWLRQVYGHVFSAKMDSAANLLTFGASRNDPHVTVFGYESAPASPWRVAAAAAGACAVALRADPARPLQTITLPGILAPAQSARFTKSNQQSLLSAGVALFQYDQAGAVSVLRAVTTYQLNKFGQPDQSYLDCETLFTLMAIQRTLKAAVTQKFARCKLVADGTNFGSANAAASVVTPKSFRAELIAQYAAMIDLGLVQDGPDFEKGLIVQLNARDPSRLDVLFDPYLVNGLRIIAVLDQFRLKVPSASAN